jgi:hypothetical protein
VVRRWEDLDYIKANVGLSSALWHLCFSLAFIFAVVGVIGDAANVKLGLTPSSWLLLAIVLSVMSTSFGISVAVEWYLKTSA